MRRTCRLCGGAGDRRVYRRRVIGVACRKCGAKGMSDPAPKPSPMIRHEWSPWNPAKKREMAVPENPTVPPGRVVIEGHCIRCKLRRIMIEGPSHGIRWLYAECTAPKTWMLWIPRRICEVDP